MRARALLPAAALIAAALLSSASADPFRSKSSVDWKSHELGVELGVDMAAAGFRMPAGRASAEEALASRRVEEARKALLGVTVDHSGSLRDAVSAGLMAEEDVLALAAGGTVFPSAFDLGLSVLSARYSYSLNELAARLVRHSRPLAPEPPLDYRPTRKYTGILVFAEGELPVRGEGRRARLEPCLFPRIFDEGMKTLFEKNYAEPAAIAAGGAVAYATAPAEVADRVGPDPIRIRARALFGTHRTDIVIDAASAAAILADAGNRALLAKCRIAVICDPDAAR